MALEKEEALIEEEQERKRDAYKLAALIYDIYVEQKRKKAKPTSPESPTS